MEMRARNLDVVRIPMWRAAKIKPHKRHDLSGPLLECSFEKIDTAPPQIQEKMFALIFRDHWNLYGTAHRRIVPIGIVDSNLSYRDERVCL